MAEARQTHFETGSGARGRARRRPRGASREPAEALASLARDWTLVETPEAGERILLFDSWGRLEALLTPERRRLLRHLKAHPEPSLSELAEALGRSYGCVHEDLSVLEMAGLIDRSTGQLRLAADKLSVVIDL
jgi:predicted transcriptional regulator